MANKLGVEIKPSKVRLLGYNRSSIQTSGCVTLPVSLPYSDTSYNLRLEVVPNNLAPILGLEACELLKIVQRVNEITPADILAEYPDVFEGIGCLDGEHDISIDASIKPVIHPPRRVPLSMMDRVKNELERMESVGIIRKVNQPTMWVNSMVCVKKRDGSVRICLDPKDLNRTVRREHHKIPTLEDIALRFNGMKHFTILDMKHGYWHICLSPESFLLITFNTPFGRYCYKRLLFRLHSSAEVFEKRVEQIFGDLAVSIYFDDLIVADPTQAEHDNNLHKVLQRAREYNVCFNKEKFQVNRQEVNYLEHVVFVDGLKPDPNKMSAIADMPEPTDRNGVQWLLGTVNFL